MSPAAEQLFQAGLALSENERIELAEGLRASLPSSKASGLDESWHGVVRRRSDELRSGAVVAIPWAEVRWQGRERMNRRR
jgi:putative addiction module component (TIGR02574 family)